MKSLALLTPGLLYLSLGIAPAAHADTVALTFDPTAPSSSPASEDLQPEESLPEVASAPTTEAPATTTSPAIASTSPSPLTFAPPANTPAKPTVAPPPTVAQAPPATKAEDSSQLFAGGSNSLVARTVGHAEGTRGADGGKTQAYYGHVDPGNGVWNLGSFSFQHCREAQYNCSTPDQADRHQLRRLQGQAEIMRQRAERLQMELSLQEELNGIDLANQAPLAVLDSPGYIEWLKKAQEKGLKGSDAVLWARVSSYWDPRLNGWNAPGLGNEEGRITHDQNRRMTAIARALDYYQQQVATRSKQKPAPSLAEQRADDIISQDLSN